MRFYQTIRNGIGAGLLGLGLAGLLPGSAGADGQVKGDLRYIHAAKNAPSYVELNIGYGLPLGIKGASWMEFFSRNGSRFTFGKGYLGKTSLMKLVKGNGLRAEIRNINKPISQVGIGIQAAIPKLPKWASGFLKFLPFWVNDKGKTIDNRVIAGYSLEVSLPRGFSVGGYGEVNIPGGLKSAQWGYGECMVRKKVRNFTLMYNPVLLGDGHLKPILEHRVTGVVGF